MKEVFKKEKHLTTNFQISLDEAYQSMEDSKFGLQIRRDASRLFWEWVNAPETDFGNVGKFKACLLLPMPPDFYLIYDDKTAKYKNCNYNELVMKEVKRLQDEYEKI